MAPLVLLLLYTWLRRGSRAEGGGAIASPELVVRGMLAIGVVLATGRLLQEVLPMRPRPRFAHPDIPFPGTGGGISMDDWSSMPSDHAMIVAAIIAAIWAASRRHALLAMAWGLVFICFPRVYLGLHHASDILVGLVLGAALAAIVLRVPLPAAAWGWLGRLDERRPALVTLGLFMICWAVGSMFDAARRLVSILSGAASSHASAALLIVAALCIPLGITLLVRLGARRDRASRLHH
jgi:undecaprenyl-diphosphatase